MLQAPSANLLLNHVRFTCPPNLIRAVSARGQSAEADAIIREIPFGSQFGCINTCRKYNKHQSCRANIRVFGGTSVRICVGAAETVDGFTRRYSRLLLRILRSRREYTFFTGHYKLCIALQNLRRCRPGNLRLLIAFDALCPPRLLAINSNNRSLQEKYSGLGTPSGCQNFPRCKG